MLEIDPTEEYFLAIPQSKAYMKVTGAEIIAATVSKKQRTRSRKSKTPESLFRRNLALAWSAHKRGGVWSTGAAIDMNKVVVRLSTMANDKILGQTDEQSFKKYQTLMDVYARV